MKKNSKFKIQNTKVAKIKTKKRWFYLLAGAIAAYFLLINLRDSAFFQKKDRLNIVTGDEKFFYYSLGLNDRVNYFISFYPDLEVTVPGGYGNYRLGALLKLASLEKNPDIIKKTYSLATSSMVDFYFYPTKVTDKVKVLFGDKSADYSPPDFRLIFFGVSNAKFFDRLYIYLNLIGKSEGQFRVIENLNTVLRGNRKALASGDFFEATQGIFYIKTYRNEQRSVQIVYTAGYKTAQQIGHILEGEGIRIADLSQDQNLNKGCEVVEEGTANSETAKSIGRFFGCRLTFGKTGAYDIIFKLGEAEKEWEVE